MPDIPRNCCPICKADLPVDPRYPDGLCNSCASTAVDEQGRRLEFFNGDSDGGFRAFYIDDRSRRDSHVCFVSGVRCWADEARFGGIVVRPYEGPANQPPPEGRVANAGPGVKLPWWRFWSAPPGDGSQH